MANLITQQQTDINTSAEIKINVELSDMEQVVITDVIQTNWDSNTGKYLQEPRKFKVVSLDYEYDLDEHSYRGEFPTKGVLRLNGMAGYYYRKGDRKVGTRLTRYWYGLTDEQIKQIPDKLHDYARKELADVLKKKLERVMQHGVVIESKINA